MLDSLPPELQEVLAKAERRDRIRDIAALPALAISGDLQLAHPNVPRTLVVSSLRLDGGTIITNGGDLTIETNHLSSHDGWIRSFADPDIPGSGLRGLDGGRVTLIVHGTMSGQLSVDLRGQKGADGNAGRDGAVGGVGPRGRSSATASASCLSPAGPGGKGLDGAGGTQGQDGFPGGSGGVLLVQAPDV
jgi:hypothetical protein